MPQINVWVPMLNRFKKNTDGNVAMMFAGTALMLVLGIGAAIDFGSASNRKQDLQDMIDAATLAAAKANSVDIAQLQEVVSTIVAEHNEVGYPIELIVQIIDGQVHVTGNTVYNTRIMGLAGNPKIDVSASAASPISALTPLKLAMVLDTTESMSGADITALKQAANGLLDELDEFISPVAVSVVPFGQYVNVGTGRRHASWLDIDKDGTSSTEEHCFDEKITITPRQCTETGRTETFRDIRDGRDFGQSTRQERTCTRAVSENTGNRICEMRTTNYEWRGCVESRQSPYNEQAAFNAKRITGVMNKSCGTEMQELSTSFGITRSTINSLSTSGNTYLPSGVMWGWRTLQEAEPLNTNVDLTKPGFPEVDPVKVMIFMTDGANTLSQGGDEPHLHNGNNNAEADQRTRALCAGAKAEGIQIFTIGYRMQEAVGNAQSILIECATSESNYYDASDANALKRAFKDIAGELSLPRLSI